jgi:hypothetical protein
VTKNAVAEVVRRLMRRFLLEAESSQAERSLEPLLELQKEQTQYP